MLLPFTKYHHINQTRPGYKPVSIAVIQALPNLLVMLWPIPNRSGNVH
jgi:hypothetical protein